MQQQYMLTDKNVGAAAQLLLHPCACLMPAHALGETPANAQQVNTSESTTATHVANDQ
jgi:hypothetical protein